MLSKSLLQISPTGVSLVERNPGFGAKIRLSGGGKDNLLFSRVAVLGDEIAGVTGHHDLIHLALAARSEIDHFPDVGKMVSGFVPAENNRA